MKCEDCEHDDVCYLPLKVHHKLSHGKLCKQGRRKAKRYKVCIDPAVTDART